MAEALFLSPEEAGRMLGCSGATVRRMVREGQLRAERRGRNFRIPRAELARKGGIDSRPSEEEMARRVLVKRLRELVAEASVVLAKLDG
jgi:excisionase family DNA binding protein